MFVDQILAVNSYAFGFQPRNEPNHPNSSGLHDLEEQSNSKGPSLPSLNRIYQRTLPKSVKSAIEASKKLDAKRQREEQKKSEEAEKEAILQKLIRSGFLYFLTSSHHS